MEKEAESLPRWPDERARRIGTLVAAQQLDDREHRLRVDMKESLRQSYPFVATVTLHFAFISVELQPPAAPVPE